MNVITPETQVLTCPNCPAKVMVAYERINNGPCEYVAWCGSYECTSYAANDGGRGSTIQKAFEDLCKRVDKELMGR